jgi:preprotein translocase subunit Sec61beta
MTASKPKLNPNLTWLFALAAATVAIVVTLALNPLKPGSWKLILGVSFAGAGVLAAAATFLSSARTLGVIGRFAVGALVVGGFYFWYTKHLLTAGVEAAAGALNATVTGDVGGFSSAGGTMIAVFVLFCFFIASVSGAVFGSRVRGGLPALQAKLARSPA